jgi:hypothetical protein
LGISPSQANHLRDPQKGDLVKRPRIDDLPSRAYNSAPFPGVSSPGEENRSIPTRRSM